MDQKQQDAPQERQGPPVFPPPPRPPAAMPFYTVGPPGVQTIGFGIPRLPIPVGGPLPLPPSSLVPFHPPTTPRAASPAAPKLPAKATASPPPPAKEPEPPLLPPAPKKPEATQIWIRIPRPRPAVLPVIKNPSSSPPSSSSSSSSTTKKRESSPSRAPAGRAAPAKVSDNGEFQFPVNDRTGFSLDHPPNWEKFACELPSWLRNTESTTRKWIPIGRHDGFAYFLVKKTRNGGPDITIVGIGGIAGACNSAGTVRNVTLAQDHNMQPVCGGSDDLPFVTMFYDFMFDDKERRSGFAVLLKRGYGATPHVLAFYTLTGECIADTEIGFNLGVDNATFAIRDGFSQGGSMTWLDNERSYGLASSRGWRVRQISSLEPFVFQTKSASVHFNGAGGQYDPNSFTGTPNDCIIVHTGQQGGPLWIDTAHANVYHTGDTVQSWTEGGRYCIISCPNHPKPPRVVDVKTRATLDYLHIPDPSFSDAQLHFIDNDHILVFASRPDGFLYFYIVHACSSPHPDPAPAP